MRTTAAEMHSSVITLSLSLSLFVESAYVNIRKRGEGRGTKK